MTLERGTDEIICIKQATLERTREEEERREAHALFLTARSLQAVANGTLSLAGTALLPIPTTPFRHLRLVLYCDGIVTSLLRKTDIRIREDIRISYSDDSPTAPPQTGS